MHCPGFDERSTAFRAGTTSALKQVVWTATITHPPLGPPCLQDELEQTRRAERERVMEIGRLHGQIDTLTELNRALKVGMPCCFAFCHNK